MRQAQVLVFESDGRLGNLLRPLCEQRGWRLRELRHADSTRNVLREGAGVLVIKVGRDVYEEMAVLEETTWTYPETATVIVGDVEHPELASLAWDLGAAFVLLPPQPRDLLPEVVAGLMRK